MAKMTPGQQTAHGLIQAVANCTDSKQITQLYAGQIIGLIRQSHDAVLEGAKAIKEIKDKGSHGYNPEHVDTALAMAIDVMEGLVMHEQLERDALKRALADEESSETGPPTDS
jgi:hypothetical protein